MKEESLSQKEKRLKNRKQAYSMKYKKGVFYQKWGYKNIVDYINQPDVLIRVISAGSMEDNTDFITITIEGFKAPPDGI